MNWVIKAGLGQDTPLGQDTTLRQDTTLAQYGDVQDMTNYSDPNPPMRVNPKNWEKWLTWVKKQKAYIYGGNPFIPSDDFDDNSESDSDAEEADYQATVARINQDFWGMNTLIKDNAPPAQIVEYIHKKAVGIEGRLGRGGLPGVGASSGWVIKAEYDDGPLTTKF